MAERPPYKKLAKAHYRQALIDERSHRPLRARLHVAAAKKLERAAIAEEIDPEPAPLPEDKANG